MAAEVWCSTVRRKTEQAPDPILDCTSLEFDDVHGKKRFFNNLSKGGIDEASDAPAAGRGTAAAIRESIPQIGNTKQETRQGASDARSRAPHDDGGPGETGDASGGALHQGKTCDPLALICGERNRNAVGQRFRAGRRYVFTGRDRQAIGTEIENEEKKDRRLEQLDLWR